MTDKPAPQTCTAVLRYLNLGAADPVVLTCVYPAGHNGTHWDGRRSTWSFDSHSVAASGGFNND